MSTATLPEAIQKELDRLETYRQQVIQLEPILLAAQRVAASTDLRPNIRILERGAPYINMEVWVDTFKQTVPLLREFAKDGLHLSEHPRHIDCPETNTRMYFLCMEGETYHTSHLRLDAALTGNGTCYRRQCGTQPVYEIVCD